MIASDYMISKKSLIEYLQNKIDGIIELQDGLNEEGIAFFANWTEIDTLKRLIKDIEEGIIK